MAPPNTNGNGAKLVYQAHDELRPGQREMIFDAIESLSNRGALVSAAPTGIGKTAASLCAALEVARQPGKNRTVMFMTGRQSQHRIVVETVRDINSRLEKGHSPVTLVDLIGQSGMCVQPFANEHPALFTSLCSEARAEAKCRPFLANTKEIGHQLISHPMHVHELVKISRDHEENGQSKPVCAWKVGREYAKHVDVIVCDYNHLFNENVREASMQGMQLEIEDLIVIVDEAHNLPKRIRDGLERKLTPDMVRNASFEVDEYLQTMESVFGKTEDEVVETIRWANSVVTDLRPKMRAWFRKLGVEVAANKGTSPDAKQREVSMDEFHQLMDEAFASASGEDNQTTLTDSKKNTIGPPKELRMRRLIDVLSGVEIEREKDEVQDLASHRLASLIDAIEQFGHTSALVLVFEDSGNNGVITSYLLDPSLVSGPIFSRVSGSILMSGTLYPPEMYSQVLGLSIDSILRAYPSPFMSKRRPVVIASNVNCTFKNRGEQLNAKIHDHVESLLRTCSGHVAVFAPSYASLADYIGSKNWKGYKLVMEERTWGKQRTDRLLDDMMDARRRGTKLLVAGVFGGKLAEGIDYHSNILDAVICIGIPMAPPSVEGKALLKYYDDKFGRGRGMKWAMTQPPMNAVLQAMGRPIRSIGDRALVLLLDERHQRGHYRACLPEDLSPIITHAGDTTEMIAQRFFDRVKPDEVAEGS